APKAYGPHVALMRLHPGIEFPAEFEHGITEIHDRSVVVGRQVREVETATRSELEDFVTARAELLAEHRPPVRRFFLVIRRRADERHQPRQIAVETARSDFVQVHRFRVLRNQDGSTYGSGP